MILRLIISAYLLNLRDCIHGLDVKTLFFCSVLPLLTSFCLNSKNGIKCSWHGTTSAYINSFVQVCVCVYVCMCLRNCVGHLTWSGQTCISRIVWVHGCNSWERNDESRLDLLLIVVHISSRWFGYVLRVADMMRLSEKGCAFCMWWTPPTTVSWQESEAPKPAGSAVRNQKARQ